MESEKKKIKITDITKALEKAQKYCAYQERCHQEIRYKLYEWGLWKNAVEEIISQLIEDGYLNEERFAIAYARGKFRIKQWGKAKIKLALKQKKVSDYCIRKGLEEIDTHDYLQTLKKILSSKSLQSNKYKAAQYAISRGFESDLVWDILNED